MAYEKNPEWQPGIAGGTKVTAAKLNRIETGIEAAAQTADAALAAATGGSGAQQSFIVSDAPTAPQDGKAQTYWVTSAVVWPAGLVWSTEPDAGVAPTITSAGLVTLLTVGTTTYAVMGSSFAVPVPPDMTAPTAGALGVTTTSTTATGTVTGATDAVALHATPYSFRVDAGVWSAWQAAAVYDWTGLTASTSYTFQHRTQDAAGNVAEGTAVAQSTQAPPSDTTPPTAGTLASSAITSSGFTLTVTGAADETALDAAPYAYSTDNGTTWTAYQAGATYDATGLAASTTYTCLHRVRDAAGNVSTGTSISVTTGAGASLTIAWAADGAQVNNPGLSYTWTALAIGAESATRRVAVMVASYLNATPSSYVTAVTIGGVTATRDAASPDTAIRTLEIWTANVPTGTTADVVVTFAASPANAAVSTYAIDGAASTPGSAGTAYGSGVSNATASVTGAAGGLVLATSMVVASGQTVTWTGDVALTRTTSSANLTRSAATVATTDTSVKTATATWSGINPTVTALAVVPL